MFTFNSGYPNNPQGFVTKKITTTFITTTQWSRTENQYFLSVEKFMKFVYLNNRNFMVLVAEL